MTPSTSARWRWLESVRQHQERQRRTRALRAELAAARAAGKARRHATRLARRTSTGPSTVDAGTAMQPEPPDGAA